MASTIVCIAIIIFNLYLGAKENNPLGYIGAVIMVFLWFYLAANNQLY